MRSRRPVASGLCVALVFVPLGAMSVLPVIFVAIGLSTLGGRVGWWVGDATINDGEEYWGWPIGLVCLGALCGAAWGVLQLVRRRGPLAGWVWPAGLGVAATVVALTFAQVLPPLWALA